jgi:hypothetical protein
MTKLLYFITIIYIFEYINSQISKYYFRLEGNEKQCLQDFFPSKTLVIYNINLNNTKIKYTLTQNLNNSLLFETSDLIFIYSFTTSQQGYYEVCLFNYDSKSTIINYNLKYGVAAKDYSSIAKTKDLKPIDIEIEKLIEKTKILYKKTHYANAFDHLTISMLDGITRKIFFFGLLMILIMIFIGIFETFYLKNFFQKRKII